MKTYKDILDEVAEPKSEDEKAFKEKHIIIKKSHPVANDKQFKATKSKAPARIADYRDEEDKDVYENLDPINKKDDLKSFKQRKDKDVNNDDEINDTDRYLHRRRKAVTKVVHKIKESVLVEKAKSEAQQQLMAMALAYKRGQMKDVSTKVKELAKSMSEKDLEDFAKTKHKGLPSRVAEGTSEADWKKDSIAVKKSNDPKYISKMINKWGERGSAWLNHPALKEETELLELSQNKLHAYIKKSSADLHSQGVKSQYHKNKADNASGSTFGKETQKKHRDLASKAQHKASNRFSGITTASGKLADKASSNQYESINFNESMKAGEKVKITDGMYKDTTGVVAKVGKFSSHIVTNDKKTVIVPHKNLVKESLALDESFKIGDKVTYQKSKQERGNAVITSISAAKKNHFYIKTEKEGTIMVPAGELELVEETNLDETNMNNKSKKKTFFGKMGADYSNKNKKIRKKYGKLYPGNIEAVALGRKIYRGEIPEEIELDEISKSTTMSYLNKARASKSGAGEVLQRQAHQMMLGDRRSQKDKEIGAKAAHTYGKRSVGMMHALNKLSAKSARVRATEETNLDEISKRTLGSYASKALNRGEIAARMSKTDSDEMAKIANKRLTGTKKAVDKIASNAAAKRINTNIDKAKEAAKNRHTDKDDQGKAYYAAQKGISKIREEMNITEAMKLNSQNLVHHKPEHKAFASDYVKGHKGDYTNIGSAEAHEKNSEHFHSTYDSKHVKSGFGGSGTTIYTHRKTGEKYKVTRSPNGKGFHGTDHVISKVNENVELDEISKTLARRYGSKAIHSKFDAHRDGDERKAEKRSKGVNMASAKAFPDQYKNSSLKARVPAIEEVEQLAELSPNTLKSYVNKATNQLDKDWLDTKKGKPGLSNKKVGNRFSGVDKAREKMNEEFKIGDTVHLGFGAKGGAGFKGKITKIDANNVEIKHPTGKTYKGPVKNLSKMDEEVNLEEAFKSGPLILNDKTSVNLSKKDADALNTMLKNVSSNNRKNMEKELMKNKKSFDEMLGFAKETI